MLVLVGSIVEHLHRKNWDIFFTSQQFFCCGAAMLQCLLLFFQKTKVQLGSSLQLR